MMAESKKQGKLYRQSKSNPAPAGYRQGYVQRRNICMKTVNKKAESLL
jgi:hypothetical protein